jgi:hypothetical protein
VQDIFFLRSAIIFERLNAIDSIVNAALPPGA